MSIQTELERLTGVKPNRREETQDFLTRVVKALDDVADNKYNKLSKDAQAWAEEATKAYNDEEEIPDFPADEAAEDEPEDAEEAESEEEEADESEDEPEADDEGEPETEEPEDEDMPEAQTDEAPRRTKRVPPKKVAAGKTSKPSQAKKTAGGDGKAGGGLTYVRQLLCKNPDMSVADLAEKVKSKGYAVSVQTLHTTRSGFRQDARAFQAAGLFKKNLV